MRLSALLGRSPRRAGPAVLPGFVSYWEGTQEAVCPVNRTCVFSPLSSPFPLGPLLLSGITFLLQRTPLVFLVHFSCLFLTPFAPTLNSSWQRFPPGPCKALWPSPDLLSCCWELTQQAVHWGSLESVHSLCGSGSCPPLWYREVWLWCACTWKLGLSCWEFVELPSPVGLPWCLRQQRIVCNAGDLSSIPGSGISPGEGSGYPLQYSCLENPMDRGAWWAAVHGVAESRTRLRDWHFQAKVSTGHPDPLRHSIFGTEKSAVMCAVEVGFIPLGICWASPFCGCLYQAAERLDVMCPPDSLGKLWALLSWDVALVSYPSPFTRDPITVCAWVCMPVCVCSISWNRKHDFKLKKKEHWASLKSLGF